MKLLSRLRILPSSTPPSESPVLSYDNTRKLMMLRDSVRNRAVPKVGYVPYAFPIGGGPAQFSGATLALAAAGGTVATPFTVEGHMLCKSIMFRSPDATLVRGPLEVAIWRDSANNSNSLPIVPGSNTTLAAFTATVGVVRTITYTNSIYLSPGIYWLTMKNNHATNTLSVGASAAGALAASAAQTKTLGAGAFGTSLDFVTATWTKITTLPVVRLNGTSFGEATIL